MSAQASGSARYRFPYDYLYFPADPSDPMPLGPFVGGVVRNTGSTSLQQGELLSLVNFNAEPSGAARRSGTVQFAGGAAVKYAPTRDVIQFFDSLGNPYVGVLDARFLYKKSGASLSRVESYYSAGTVHTSGAHLLAAGAVDFSTADLRASDFVQLRPGAANQSELQIASRLTKSHLLLTVAPTSAATVGTAYKALRAFNYVGAASFVDWTIAPILGASGDASVVIADGGRPLWTWDGVTLAPWDVVLSFVPKAVAFFQDRLWCLNTQEGGLTFRRRIRWSTILDMTDFTGDSNAQWLDRPYSGGEGMRLVPFGKLLAAFYSDGIDIGRVSNMAGDTLPLQWEQLNTAGAGLVSMKAVCAFYDGIFCVLQDGIYFLDNNGFQPIGAPIWRYATDGLKSLDGTYAAVNQRDNCLVVGFPAADGNGLGPLWKYNYLSKKWSWDERWSTCLASYLQGDVATWDGSTGTWDSHTESWNSYAVSFRKRLILGRGLTLEEMDPLATSNSDGSAVEATLETGDLRFGAPGMVKTLLEIDIELGDPAQVAIPLHVWASTDRGITWRALGTATVAAGDDTGRLTVKATGNMIRLRLVTNVASTPFVIDNALVRVRVRGRETHYGGV